MTKRRDTKTSSLWGRSTKALGRLLIGVISLPDRPSARAADRDFPIFPPF